MYWAAGVAADWASVPVIMLTEVARRLALAGALRSMDVLIRFIAQRGSAQDMSNVREGRGIDSQFVCAVRLRTMRQQLCVTCVCARVRADCNVP